MPTDLIEKLYNVGALLAVLGGIAFVVTWIAIPFILLSIRSALRDCAFHLGQVDENLKNIRAMTRRTLAGLKTDSSPRVRTSIE
jgi:hypothetical protein